MAAAALAELAGLLAGYAGGRLPARVSDEPAHPRLADGEPVPDGLVAVPVRGPRRGQHGRRVRRRPPRLTRPPTPPPPATSATPPHDRSDRMTTTATADDVLATLQRAYDVVKPKRPAHAAPRAT